MRVGQEDLSVHSEKKPLSAPVADPEQQELSNELQLAVIVEVPAEEADEVEENRA